MNKRPLDVTILGWFLVPLGVGLFVYHLTEINFRQTFRAGDLLIPFSELIWTVSGVFMLLGRNWARWLVLAWLAFHISLSFHHSTHEAAVHGVLWAVIAYLLFRPEARAFFRQPVRNSD
jgi:hypothetical protein